MLGNTLAHIGAAAFREWLAQQCGSKPAYIIFDFAVRWKELLDQADPDIVCGPLRQHDSDVGTVYSHMTTAAGPGWVKRGVVLQSLQNEYSGKSIAQNSLCLSEHRLLTRQFADPPETYFKILRARGYQNEGEPGMRYRSGWGEHDLYVFKRVANSAPFPWPTVRDEQPSFNSIWYNHLKQAWQKLPHPRDHKNVNMYPLAILPFSPDRVYARYIPRDDAECQADYASLFDAVMWVIDPRDAGLQHAGAPKSEGTLPYAPNLFRVLLSRAAAGVLEHFYDVVAKELRIETNAADMELADLERMWMTGRPNEEDEDIYYGVPVYLDGVPAFLVVVRVLELVGTERGDVIGRLKEIRDDIENKVAYLVGAEHWTEIVSEWSALTGKNVESLWEAITRLESSDRPWTSWLDVRPGMTIHQDNEVTRNRFAMFKNRHRDAIMNVTGIALVKEMEERASFTFVTQNITEVREMNKKVRIEGSQGVAVNIDGSVGGDQSGIRESSVGDLGSLDYGRIEEELRAIRAVLVERDGSAERDSALVAMSEAEAAALKKDEAGLIKALRKGGRFVAEFARSVGASITAELIKKEVGL